MRLATITLPGRGETDRLLAEVAARLQRQGVPLAGAVQFNVECGDECEMEVQVLPDGPVIGISQSLGPGSQGCRLDAGALEGAAQRVLDTLPVAQMVVLNKFGKQEILGRGMVAVIAAAMERDLPVLISVAPQQRAEFLAFAGDLAVPLAPEDAAQWCREAVQVTA